MNKEIENSDYFKQTCKAEKGCHRCLFIIILINFDKVSEIVVQIVHSAEFVFPAQLSETKINFLSLTI